MHNPFNIRIRHTVYNPDGSIKFVSPWKRSNTLLKGFAQLFLVQLSQAAQIIKMINDTNVSCAANGVNLDVACAAGTTTYGILAGTGTNAVTRTDNKLQTQLTANFTHGATTFQLLNPNADDWHILIHRTFTNATANEVVIEEVGLAGRTASGTDRVLLDRTLSHIHFSANAQIAITYKIQI